MTPYPQVLKGVTISGYRGVSDGQSQELRLEDFSLRKNVFIGQNNGGKSTAYRLLSTVTGELASLKNRFPHQGAIGHIDTDHFWQQNTAIEPWVVLTFRHPGEGYTPLEHPVGPSLIHDGEWRLGIRLWHMPQRKAGFFASPQVWLPARNQWMDIAQRPGLQFGKVIYVNEWGEYVNHPSPEKLPLVGEMSTLSEPVNAWANAGRFFDAFRSLQRGGNADQRIQDGTGVLQRLLEWQNDRNRSAEFHRFRTRLMSRLNRLFDRPYAELLLHPSPGLDLSLRLDAEDAVLVPLRSMGSGISQMVLILASLEEDAFKGQPRHYHLEEPELHLHPRLLRRFMGQLNDFPKVQFFLSTHSNVILDTLDAADRVYWFSQGPAGHCTARPVEGVVEQHAVLDALGVSGSSLLQTNCVIWVEGPSDKLYLREWLTELAAEKNVELLEGADYAFVFYGGSVLSHFGIDPEASALEGLIPMLSISRYCAVLMDRDRPPAHPGHPLRKAKQDICDAAEQDRIRRLACVTEGREIENDLPPTVFKEGLAKHLGKPLASLDGMVLTGEKRYPDEVIVHLGLADKDAESVKEKLGRKVMLATAVLDRMRVSGAKLGPPPPYVKELFAFVQRSRAE